MAYYRWPCGMFDSLGGPWQVYRFRPMPCTPAGDLVAAFESKGAADLVAKELNEAGVSLAEAKARFDA